MFVNASSRNRFPFTCPFPFLNWDALRKSTFEGGRFHIESQDLNPFCRANNHVEAIQLAHSGAWVLCLYGNYGGDRMNFDMACELLAAEGIQTRTVPGTDDMASAPPTESLASSLASPDRVGGKSPAPPTCSP